MTGNARSLRLVGQTCKHYVISAMPIYIRPRIAIARKRTSSGHRSDCNNGLRDISATNDATISRTTSKRSKGETPGACFF